MKRLNFGLLQSIVNLVRGWFVSTNEYADPVLRDPHHRQRSRHGTRSNRPTKKRQQLPCEPGTIVYRDWLVRELGYDRRLADGYLYAYRNGYSIKMPMPGDLAAN